VIARLGVGLDNIDVAVARERGIPVTRVPDYCVDEVATHALAMALSLWRQLPGYDAATRSGEWGVRAALPVRRLAGSRVAVLGRGPIGRTVARHWQALDVKVTDDPAGVDIVSVHLPLTEATRGSIDGTVFDAVAPGAVLVNCGRGGLVDLDAALAALDDGRLSGMGLDVYPVEPLPAGHPLLSRSDVLLSPHVAFYSEGSLRELRERATQSVIDILTGRPDG
jgi:D-3-phosphoglycerate dehydrogenase